MTIDNHSQDDNSTLDETATALTINEAVVANNLVQPSPDDDGAHASE
jgi:hypothetical protein